ncbi:MAG: hypothetical protein PVF43_14410 [Candidatus Eiseniibacteriota bacterium]|jgi:hypothetical protein
MNRPPTTRHGDDRDRRGGAAPAAVRAALMAVICVVLFAGNGTGEPPPPVPPGDRTSPTPGRTTGRGGLHGAFFRVPTNLSDSPSATSLARTSPRSIVLDDDGTGFALWMERIVHSGGTTREIALKAYRTGAGWDSLMTPVAWWDGEESTDPTCAIDHGGAIHLAWVDRRPGQPQVFAQLFDRRRGRLSDPLQLSDGSAPAADVALATGPDGWEHAVWTEVSGARSTLRHRTASPGGRWSPIDTPPLPDAPVIPAAYAPDIVVDDDGRAHCVWEWGRPEGVGIGYASWERDRGWSSPTLVAPATTGRYAQTPVVAVSPHGDVWVAWAVLEADGSSRIMLRGRPPSGVWRGAQPITASQIEVVAPALAVDHWGTVHLVWEEGMAASDEEDPVPSREIMYAALVTEPGAGNAQPIAPRSLTPTPGGPRHRPMLAVDATGRIAAAWLDEMIGLGDLVVRMGVSGFAPPPR